MDTGYSCGTYDHIAMILSVPLILTLMELVSPGFPEFNLKVYPRESSKSIRRGWIAKTIATKETIRKTLFIKILLRRKYILKHKEIHKDYDLSHDISEA